MEDPARPTDAELDLLAVLWELGPATVREACDRLAEQRGDAPGYTTVLKQLQIMHAKGLVSRDESQRTHVYRPAEPPRRTRRRLVRDLMGRAFAGSAKSMVLESLGHKRLTPSQRRRLNALLDEIEPGETP